MGYFITTNARLASEIAMFGPQTDSEMDLELPPSPFEEKKTSLSSFVEQGSQEDIIPINPSDNSELIAQTGGLEDLEMDQKVKKGKVKVEEFHDHVVLCFSDSSFPEGISSFMVRFF